MLSGPPPALAASMSAAQMSCSDSRGVAENLGDLRIGHDARTARPSRADSDRQAAGSTSVDVDLRIFAARQRARDDVAPRMLARGGRAHRPGADLLFDPRVIVRQLIERARCAGGRRGCRRRARRTPRRRRRGAPTPSWPCRAGRSSRRSPWQSSGWRGGTRPSGGWLRG